MFKLKFIFPIIFLAVFLVVVPAKATTDVLFSPKKVEIKKGEAFNIIVSLDPGREKNYTSILELKYPPDFLQVTSFQFGEGWTPISQPGYDLIDNKGGILIKTAGVAGGFMQEKVFGTVFFQAKNEGQAVINVGNNSSSLNNRNKNVLNGFLPEIEVDIKLTEEELEELFDISLEIDEQILEDMDKFLGRIIFTNFGEGSTSIDLTFIIKDEDDNEIHREKESVLVQTGEVVDKKFEDLSLPPGKYSIFLQTLYDIDVFDEFKQDFEILPEKKFYQDEKFLLSVLFALIILTIVFFIARRRKNNFEN